MTALLLLISIVFWNIENFFDYKDGGFSDSDREFSSYGTRGWTRAKFDAKVRTVGKTLLWAGVPDIVGLAEVENDFALKRLIYSDVLRKCRYRFIHYESHDSRGIDVALLWRHDSLQLIRTYPLPVRQQREDGHTEILASRDILYAHFKQRNGGRSIHVFVNHHPSKLGGSNACERREAAMLTLHCSVDSLIVRGEDCIVAMGDFNDTPDGAAFVMIEGQLDNLGAALTQKRGKGNVGSIRFHGHWQLIDNFLVRLPEQVRATQMEVLSPSFLLERDRQYPGDKPRRTYIGPRYNGGVSDHLPIRLRLALF